MKILLLDIETAPNLATVWGMFKQNIAVNQLIESSYTLCWAAKWLGHDDEDVKFESILTGSAKQMVRKIHKLLDEADVVVHYNGTKFDIPTLNKEFLMMGFSPPSPYKQVDLLRVARNQFRFPSNKLDYVAQALGLGKKTSHKGHELWLQCMNRDTEAWETMEEYNKNDVILLEQVYYALLPWIKNHPNQSVYSEELVCTNCGSDHYVRRGTVVTATGKHQRYKCKGCGTWFRGTTNISGTKERFVHVH